MGSSNSDSAYDKLVLETLLKKCDKEKSISRVISSEVGPAVAKGDNFAGDLFRAKLAVVLGTGKQTSRSLIIKEMPPASQDVTGDMKRVRSLFSKEIQMYAIVIPKMEEIIYGKGDAEEVPWCELIGTLENQTIVLRDLKELNYVSLPRQEMLDMTHTAMAVLAMARFHILGKVLMLEGSLDPTQFTNYPFAEINFVQIVLADCLRIMSTTIKEEWGPEWKEVADGIYHEADVAWKKYEKLKQLPCSFKVINHGDCWTNNLMYKYARLSKNPISVKLLDYQMCHYGSFAWDLTYFLCVGVEGETRKTKYNDILELYHKGLVEYAALYGYVEPLPDLSDIHEDMRRLDYLAKMLLCSNFPITSASIPNAMKETVLENGERKLAPNREVFMSPLYRRRVESDLRDLQDKNFHKDLLN